jgi:hypothetical protein
VDEHRPGQARIATDERVPVQLADRDAHMERELRGHVDVPEAANA